MGRWISLICALLLCLAGWGLQPAFAAGPDSYVVQPGDTLSAIASRYGLSVGQLATANGLAWNSWVYTGQQLLIPANDAAGSIAPAAPIPAAPTIVDLGNGDWIEVPAWAGVWQPAANSAEPLPLTVAPFQAAPVTAGPIVAPIQAAPVTAGGDRWIDVNLTAQTLTAYEGQAPVFTTLVSTGLWQYPTIVGTFSIYVKYTSARMSGGSGAYAYDLPNVPYVMYFHGDYGLHGTYWHNNFGTPMSHGCVNLATPDAEWLFNWASVGTTVVTHY